MVQPLNFRKHFSEITVDPKVPPDGPTFWSGLEARDPLTPAWRQRPFSRQKLNFFQKSVFQPDWPKNGWVMAKKRMPIYGINGILRPFSAHNLVKYQYFSMKPILFNNYYRLPLYIFWTSFILKYIKMWFLLSKNPQNCIYLSSRFFESACYKNAYKSDQEWYFS